MLFWFCSVLVGTSCRIFFVLFNQKTAYDMRISDWSSDVCSSDLVRPVRVLGFCGDGCYTQCPTRQIGVLFVRWALGAQRWAIPPPSARRCPPHAVSGLPPTVLFHKTADPSGGVARIASSIHHRTQHHYRFIPATQSNDTRRGKTGL